LNAPSRIVEQRSIGLTFASEVSVDNRTPDHLGRRCAVEVISGRLRPPSDRLTAMRGVGTVGTNPLAPTIPITCCDINDPVWAAHAPRSHAFSYPRQARTVLGLAVRDPRLAGRSARSRTGDQRRNVKGRLIIRTPSARRRTEASSWPPLP
jgi:hypothetical protein